MFPDVHHPRTPRWKVANIFIVSSIFVYVIAIILNILEIVKMADSKANNESGINRHAIVAIILLSFSLLMALSNILIAALGIFYPHLGSLYTLIFTCIVDIILDIVLISLGLFALSILPSFALLLVLYTAIDELKRANNVT